MDLGIAGKTALVTGAGGGLGKAIVETLSEEGVHVAACDVSHDSLKYVEDLAQSGARAKNYGFDLADFAAMEASVERIQEEVGAIDILINITGGPPPTPACDTPAEDWERHFHSMVTSVIHLTHLVLPAMRERGFGRIITSTSSGAVAPIPNLAISNGLRASLHGWSKTLAGEVARDGVTVNVILPGRIATERIRALDEAKAAREGKSVEDVSSASTASIPVGRYGEPREYADVVAFLSSARASYINGTTTRVDGGLIPTI